MSGREDEERRKKQCPSRGLGLAAAAIGVGVGAALYYYFNKRPEHPDGEGATSSNWTCEEPQALNHSNSDEMDSEDCTPGSDNNTSDTSNQEEDNSVMSVSDIHSESDVQSSDEEDSVSEYSFIIPDSQEGSMNVDSPEESLSEYSVISDSQEGSLNVDSPEAPVVDIGSPPDTDQASRSVEVISSDSDTDWDVASISSDMPTVETSGDSSLLGSDGEQMRLIQEQPFRERSWSLEECSICCDIMLKDQHIKTLPCTHRFHSSCILPWLEIEQQQTCPNCRKQAV